MHKNSESRKAPWKILNRLEVPNPGVTVNDYIHNAHNEHSCPFMTGCEVAPVWECRETCFVRRAPWDCQGRFTPTHSGTVHTASLRLGCTCRLAASPLEAPSSFLHLILPLWASVCIPHYASLSLCVQHHPIVTAWCLCVLPLVHKRKCTSTQNEKKNTFKTMVHPL